MRKFQFSLRSLVVGVLALSGLLLLSAWYFDWGHQPVEELREFVGMTEPAILAKLGEPNSIRRLRYEEPVSGFSSERPPQPWNPPFELGELVHEFSWQYQTHSVHLIFRKSGEQWIVFRARRLQNGTAAAASYLRYPLPFLPFHEQETSDK